MQLKIKNRSIYLKGFPLWNSRCIFRFILVFLLSPQKKLNQTFHWLISVNIYISKYKIIKKIFALFRAFRGLWNGSKIHLVQAELSKDFLSDDCTCSNQPLKVWLNYFMTIAIRGVVIICTCSFVKCMTSTSFKYCQI